MRDRLLGSLLGHRHHCLGHTHKDIIADAKLSPLGCWNLSKNTFNCGWPLETNIDPESEVANKYAYILLMGIDRRPLVLAFFKRRHTSFDATTNEVIFQLGQEIIRNVGAAVIHRKAGRSGLS